MTVIGQVTLVDAQNVELDYCELEADGSASGRLLA